MFLVFGFHLGFVPFADPPDYLLLAALTLLRKAMDSRGAVDFQKVDNVRAFIVGLVVIHSDLLFG
jgi:hypothetical protein